ncbi:PaaI family thioesterase [Candidatus Sumerlaeota bacterium]|nr:PaaI family thioesterase [Candidatus Sumerlaeota bacterium]
MSHAKIHPPDPIAQKLGPEPGWLEFKQTAWMNRPNFVVGDPDTNRYRIRYYFREKDMAVVGKAWFGPGTEGPPGHAHGGSMAALLDEVMGPACFLKGHIVLAAKIEVSFRNKLPLGSVVTMEGWVEKIDGRKITPRAHLLGPDGLVYVESTGLFIKFEPHQFAALGKWDTREIPPAL